MRRDCSYDYLTHAWVRYWSPEAGSRAIAVLRRRGWRVGLPDAWSPPMPPYDKRCCRRCGRVERILA